MSGFHETLGFLVIVAASVVAAAAGIAWAFHGRRWGTAAARIAEVLAVVLGVLVLVTIFIGGLLLITGSRPMTPLHMLLAVAALAAVPVAFGAARWREHGTGRSRARAGWLAWGALVTVLLGLLLAVTG